MRKPATKVLVCAAQAQAQAQAQEKLLRAMRKLQAVMEGLKEDLFRSMGMCWYLACMGHVHFINVVEECQDKCVRALQSIPGSILNSNRNTLHSCACMCR